MKKIILCLLVYLIGFQISGMTEIQLDKHLLKQVENVILINSNAETVYGIKSVVYKFEIESHGIPARQVTVRVYEQKDSKGAVILTTGGPGINYYGGRNPEAIKTIELLYKNGLEIYEIKWEGEMGWATNARGLGFHIAVGAFSELIKHLHQYYFGNTNIVIAHGNSGGAFQIAYGLAMYGLDHILNMVVLTGGPPVSNLKTGIFGKGNEPEYWPLRLGGRSFTDYIMGWDGEGDYCVRGEAPEEIKNKLDTVSLVSPKQSRLYHYNTFVNFVQSDDPSNAHHQAKIYYDVITSGKTYYYLPEVKNHNVPASIEGASKIRELILDFINSD